MQQDGCKIKRGVIYTKRKRVYRFLLVYNFLPDIPRVAFKQPVDFGHVAYSRYIG